MNRYLIFSVTSLLLIGWTSTPSEARLPSPPLSKSSKILTPLSPSPLIRTPKPPENEQGNLILEDVTRAHPEITRPVASWKKQQESITYDIPITINKGVEWFLDYFQSSGRKTFRSWLIRSGRYLRMIRKTFKDYQLPTDLAYLALIESGFNHEAYSPCHAVGIWQFIRGTAKGYGLKINWWVDERRDPEKSTIAAAKHLSDLYHEFGSWYLAMAGYNAGAGRIRWAIRKAGTKDYWYLARKRLLRKETRSYVPKMIAATLIAKEPERYGFNELEYLPPLSCDKFTVNDATALKLIASLLDTTEGEIALLNPELKRWCTPPGVRYTLKIPCGKGELLKKGLAQMNIKKMMAFTVHKIEKGETLSTIAKRYGSSVTPINVLDLYQFIIPCP
jgi:membrane-bound lytic murein transglycosylase D